MNKYSNLLNFKTGFLLISSLIFTSCSTHTNESEIENIAELKDTVSLDTLSEIEKVLLDTSVYKEQSSDIANEIAEAVANDFEKEKSPVSNKKPVLKEVELHETTPQVAAVTTTSEPKKIEVSSVKKEFNHEVFDELLKKYVTNTGKVNYQGFKNDRTLLKTYLEELKNNEPKSSDSKNKKLAFWINAYNAFTIELILKNNIPSSIMNINNGKAWDLSFIEIGNKTYTLNYVEHEIIRKQLSDPRIHFACVCAAKSCPKLLNMAYTESNINSKLDEQAKYFINDSSKNQIADGNLKVSQLFNWYASDFGEINSYLRKYYSGTFKDDKKIEFLEYDWSLNN